MVTRLERLECRHEVVATSYSRCDDTFCQASGDCALDDGSDGVHGPDDLILILGWDMQLNLLKEIFRCAEATDNENVLSQD